MLLLARFQAQLCGNHHDCGRGAELEETGIQVHRTRQSQWQRKSRINSQPQAACDQTTRPEEAQILQHWRRPAPPE